MGVELREVGVSRGGPAELKLVVIDIGVVIVISTERGAPGDESDAPEA